MNNNPLLQTTLPDFAKIQARHFKPAIIVVLKKNRQTIKKLLSQKKYSWHNFVAPLDAINEQLMFVWSTINHLNAVMGLPEIRKAYTTCLPLVTNYMTELAQNTEIYQAFNSIAQSSEYKNFNSTQKTIIQKKLRDFRLAGVNLPPAKKKLFMRQTQQLAKLGNKFNSNVIDATQKWSICLTKKQTTGIPTHILNRGQINAKKKHKSGWCFSLDLPSYQALITYADSQALRKKIYIAFATRASDIGPMAGKWDNSKIIARILKIRFNLAKLLQFNNYAEYSLAPKMAKNPNQVLDFLTKLFAHSLPTASREFNELQKFAKKQGKKSLAVWDMAYYAEKLSKKKFKFSQEDLRPYFPENQVLTGMFTIAQHLYGITIKEITEVAVWHPTVRFFSIYDTKKILRGQFYIDLYCRENKRGGAWMDDCKTRYKLKNGTVQTPVAYLVCNFTPPLTNKPALFTHQDVITLFHEFGHCLHHLLTRVDYIAAAGINNVPWDAVEFPSQFMENWCWQPKSLKLISKHYKTQALIPPKLLQQLLASQHYHAAMSMLRQLKLALLDFKIHLEFNPKNKNQLIQIIKQLNTKIKFLPTAKYSRIAHSFTHIFSGGYAAGYYSYKWAEVLAADAFAKFLEHGIFAKQVGQEFLTNILEAGGSEDPIVLFKKFRGREPKIDALLQQYGILTNYEPKKNRSCCCNKIYS